MKDLENRIQKIEERNLKVEGDKAWETSFIRKFIIIILTYVFAVMYLSVADNTNPFFGAIVPCAGFYISTQSIDFIKKLWLKKRK